MVRHMPLPRVTIRLFCQCRPPRPRHEPINRHNHLILTLFSIPSTTLTIHLLRHSRAAALSSPLRPRPALRTGKYMLPDLAWSIGLTRCSSTPLDRPTDTTPGRALYLILPARTASPAPTTPGSRALHLMDTRRWVWPILLPKGMCRHSIIGLHFLTWLRYTSSCRLSHAAGTIQNSLTAWWPFIC